MDGDLARIARAALVGCHCHQFCRFALVRVGAVIPLLPFFFVASLNQIIRILYRVHCSPAMPNFRRDHVLHNPVSACKK